MRYATVVVRWDAGDLHPLDDAVANASDVTIETTYYINPIRDGTYAELSRLRGDPTRIRELLRETPEVLDFDVPPGSDGITYTHYESSPLMDALLGVLFDHEIVLEWPVEFVDTGTDRGVRVTFLGTERALSAALNDVPSDFGIELERMGEYLPSISDPVATLTGRQQEVLAVAVREGYYEIPRETTHREIADELSVAPGTISKQLQRIEMTLISSLVAASQ
ncbi:MULTISPECIES: helix-turn-helix domain-containing protein [unclassified Haladaptatus]|uniref:helix-turn-helix domain-containing protein n=1 Tax=unclassified Haladaptatus TaxID=2622732 RepID=UPI00209BC4D7|nr:MULTISPECIES: helix-turn-helix domain-containing protein [unclassified Haladaptatus]MCO8242481.1 helix-turn-helix domain-containing protein [Haladaptatus sp. AB643]MCO8252238.1 helix-turn-helix domain-containing protein [Haladaptatus sp. AB618]